MQHKNLSPVLINREPEIIKCSFIGHYMEIWLDITHILNELNEIIE